MKKYIVLLLACIFTLPFLGQDGQGMMDLKRDYPTDNNQTGSSQSGSYINTENNYTNNYRPPTNQTIIVKNVYRTGPSPIEYIAGGLVNYSLDRYYYGPYYHNNRFNYPRPYYGPYRRFLYSDRFHRKRFYDRCRRYGIYP